jgi:tetratricopeptide (TPR) repeat protein
MVTVLDIAGQEIKEAAERLEKTSAKEHAAELEAFSPALSKSIKEGTLTVAEIDSFLQDHLKVPPKLKEYLLGKKAWLLLLGGQADQALHFYDEVLEGFPESPSTWAMKGNALLQMGRIEEALQAFQRAYELREYFGPQKQEYLKDLFWAWGTTTFFLGLDAILEQDSTKLGERVHQFLDIKEKAKSAGLEAIPGKVVFREPGSEPQGKVSGDTEHTLIVYAHEAELRDALEELELAIKLLSIKDPFEGFRALAKEVSKVWPKGLSAVEAIREQRDREWKT